MVEIAVQTEDKYGVKIPDEDLAGLRTVGDVVNYIEKLEQENPRPRPTSARSWRAPTSDTPFHCQRWLPNVVVTARRNDIYRA